VGAEEAVEALHCQVVTTSTSTNSSSSGDGAGDDGERRYSGGVLSVGRFKKKCLSPPIYIYMPDVHAPLCSCSALW
jgi:hypothetical protein